MKHLAPKTSCRAFQPCRRPSANAHKTDMYMSSAALRPHSNDSSLASMLLLRRLPAALRGPRSVPAAAAAKGAQLDSQDQDVNNNTNLAVRTLQQLLLLAVGLAALILLPAHLSGQLATGRGQQAAASYCLYLLFFASGTIRRMVRHGRLASRQQDAQRSSKSSTLALVLFAAVGVPAGHYGAWWDTSLAAAAGSGIGSLMQTLLPAVGYALMLAGWALNTAAAAALGKNFNRLLAPDRLVTSGCYAWVQHPIYTSYIMLFVGHCCSLGAPAAAVVMWAACRAYYSGRTRIEEQVLADAFGQEYLRYRKRTGRFLPRLFSRGNASK